MKSLKKITFLFALSTLASIFFLSGLVYIYLSTFYFISDRDIKAFNDPRWRVFDFNSRQATEDEIYTVAEIPVITKVKEVSKRKLRFYFSPEIKNQFVGNLLKRPELYSFLRPFSRDTISRFQLP